MGSTPVLDFDQRFGSRICVKQLMWQQHGRQNEMRRIGSGRASETCPFPQADDHNCERSACLPGRCSRLRENLSTPKGAVMSKDVI